MKFVLGRFFIVIVVFLATLTAALILVETNILLALSPVYLGLVIIVLAYLLQIEQAEFLLKAMRSANRREGDLREQIDTMIRSMIWAGNTTADTVVQLRENNSGPITREAANLTLGFLQSAFFSRIPESYIQGRPEKFLELFMDRGVLTTQDLGQFADWLFHWRIDRTRDDDLTERWFSAIRKYYIRIEIVCGPGAGMLGKIRPDLLMEEALQLLSEVRKDHCLPPRGMSQEIFEEKLNDLICSEKS
jgi:hypothetical protein